MAKTIINIDLLETRAAAVADPKWPEASDISYKSAIMPDQAALMATMSPEVVLELIRRLRKAEELEYTEAMHGAAINAAMAGGLVPDPDLSLAASLEKFNPITDVIIAVLKAARTGFGGANAHS